jgi:hypothetical protein
VKMQLAAVSRSALELMNMLQLVFDEHMARLARLCLLSLRKFSLYFRFRDYLIRLQPYSLFGACSEPSRCQLRRGLVHL